MTNTPALDPVALLAEVERLRTIEAAAYAVRAAINDDKMTDDDLEDAIVALCGLLDDAVALRGGGGENSE